MISFFLVYLDSDDDKALFESIYISFRKQMFVEAYSIVYSESDAEDIVHSVFYNIVSKHWDRIKGIQDDRDLKNYLLISTKNTAINYRKKMRKIIYSENDEIYEIAGLTEYSDASFIDMICDRYDYVQTVKAIREMNEIYRDVLYLHFVLELSVSQIAVILNRPKSTVKKQLVRGKNKLLQNLKGKECSHVNE